MHKQTHTCATGEFPKLNAPRGHHLERIILLLHITDVRRLTTKAWRCQYFTTLALSLLCQLGFHPSTGLLISKANMCQVPTDTTPSKHAGHTYTLKCSYSTFALFSSVLWQMRTAVLTPSLSAYGYLNQFIGNCPSSRSCDIRSRRRGQNGKQGERNVTTEMFLCL